MTWLYDFQNKSAKEKLKFEPIKEFKIKQLKIEFFQSLRLLENEFYNRPKVEIAMILTKINPINFLKDIFENKEKKTF